MLVKLVSIAAVLAGSAVAARDSNVVGKEEMGCNAFGPLGPYNTVILANCEPGQQYTCLATDSSGCMAGDPGNIQEVVAREPSTCGMAGGSASVTKAPFTCPDTGMISCSVIFTKEGRNNAGMYGLNIVQGTVS